MAKKFAELMVESDFTGLVAVRPENKARRIELTESVTRLINLMNDKKLSTYRFGAAMEEAQTTSDFPIMLGLIVEQVMIAKYKAIVPDWRDYIATGTQGDFKPTQLVKIWGLEGPLGEVPQHGEYPEALMAEGKTTIQLAKYGKAFGVSWELMLADRLGAFTDLGARLADAARRTESRNVTKLYSGVAGPNATLFAPVNGTVVHPVTKQAVTNSSNLPLTAQNLATILGKIRRQVDAEGEPIFFDKVHVVVPASLEIQLYRILNPASLIVSGGDSSAGAKGVTTTSQNILNHYSIVPHVNPYLEIIDGTANKSGTWYVFVDKADAAAVQMNFLRNHENPEVFMKASDSQGTNGEAVDSMEGSFDNDTKKWKVRHCMGGTTVDPLAAYANVTATVPNS